LYPESVVLESSVKPSLVKLHAQAWFDTRFKRTTDFPLGLLILIFNRMTKITITMYIYISKSWQENLPSEW